MKNVPTLVNVQEVGAEIIGDLCQMGGKLRLRVFTAHDLMKYTVFNDWMT